MAYRGKKWLGYALRLLSRRDYTWKELSASLEKKGASAEEKEAVCRYLQEKGYLSEERLVRNLVEQQLNRGRGFMYIRDLLERRGVEKNLVAEVTAGFDYERELDAAKSYLEKCLKRRGHISELRLRSRGFSSRTIERLQEIAHDQKKCRN